MVDAAASKCQEIGLASHFCGVQSSGAAIRAAEAKMASVDRASVDRSALAFMADIIAYRTCLRKMESHWAFSTAFPSNEWIRAI